MNMMFNKLTMWLFNIQNEVHQDIGPVQESMRVSLFNNRTFS